jgi:hypothetical protein
MENIRSVSLCLSFCFLIDLSFLLIFDPFPVLLSPVIMIIIGVLMLKNINMIINISVVVVIDLECV